VAAGIPNDFLEDPENVIKRFLRSWRFHVLLFLLTCATTTLVGGPAYAAVLMSILFCHEMGHYLQARRYRVPATLPYFIPVPLPPFGTMGAVIRMNNLGADRKVLFDIGITGPLAGLVIAVPATFWGLAHSQVVQTASLAGHSIQLGDSLFFAGLSRLVVGPLPAGYDVMLHPIAFAGWAGLFVTALNLLPIGQLDGGHVLYALLGRKSHFVAIVVALGFVATAIFVNWAWTLMVILVFLIGLRHPPTADDEVPLGRTRLWLGIASLAFFVLSFTPDPLRVR
jgi:membrane-associated protease RseP (regulator of RpoE activity)